MDNLLNRLTRLNEIGIALSAEKNRDLLLEKILLGAKELTGADGGSLYIVTEDDHLKFAIFKNSSLDLSWGGTSEVPVPLPKIPLSGETVVAHAAVHRVTVNIDDVSQVQDFDFSGSKEFDRQMGYLSRSFLTVPMMDHRDEVIGVLQLINAKGPQGFSVDDQKLAESLASQAAIAMTNRQLVQSLHDMLEGFVRAMAGAIDEESPHTGKHCQRVPVLAKYLAEAANSTRSGPYRNFSLSSEEMYELHIASVLHDCGKITTPIHITDKSTRLQVITDRIELIDTRFELLKLQASSGEECRQIESDQAFLHECNQATTVITPERRARVQQIAKRSWVGANGETKTLLSDEELDLLLIPKGTLNASERSQVENHAQATLNILGNLSYPDYLQNIPNIAGSHHERIDGHGYPRGLTGEQMSVQAKMLCIADIFEALTAKDRPYKKSMTLSQALKVLEAVKDDGHVDPDLFEIFMKEKVYLKYAQEYLLPEQLD